LTRTPTRGARWRAAILVAVVAGFTADPLAQSITVHVVGDVLHIKAPDLRFIAGEALNRLKNGRTVRFEFDLDVLPKAGGQAVAQGRESFNLSYDLWEERFAATRVGAPSRSTSHLSQAHVEAWCLEQVMVPVSALGRLGTDASFWLRLAYRVVDRERSPDASGDDRFTLRSLIDMLSRRRSAGDLGATLERGPFRLSN